MAFGQDIKRYFGNRFEDANLSNILLRPDQHELIWKWIKQPTHFLIFLGIPGCGKTYTSIAITLYLYKNALKHGKEDFIKFVPQRIIFEELKNCINKNWSLSYILDELDRALLLTIDDFGATRNSEWEKEQMTYIIDRRYVSKKPTIITSNLSLNEISEIYHPRVADRLGASENLIITEWNCSLRKDGY